MEDYRAAIVSYEIILKEFPDTEFREDILFKIINAYYSYALKSIQEKQKERYENAVKAYYDFVSVYPESKYIVDVEKLRNQLKEEMHKSGFEEL